MFNLSSEILIAAVSMIASLLGTYEANMRLDPQQGWPQLEESFAVHIVVEAQTPVNVFMGDISFDPNYLTVESIRYNNAVADLWTTEPWYSNGAGTINFAGGTTRPGGFTGLDTLITIEFTTKKVGDARVSFEEIRILRHDGLGNDATIAKPMDGLFSVQNQTSEIITAKTGNNTRIHVIPERQQTDLNGDGQQTIVDVSIFMRDLTTQNLQSDFNQDGRVTLADMSILFQAPN